jgi:sarcosine oxidase delta subunit
MNIFFFRATKRGIGRESWRKIGEEKEERFWLLWLLCLNGCPACGKRREVFWLASGKSPTGEIGEPEGSYWS